MQKHVHTNSKMTYDDGCYGLAGGFLFDIGNECLECRHALAIAIQTAIEDHLREFEDVD